MLTENIHENKPQRINYGKNDKKSIITYNKHCDKNNIYTYIRAFIHTFIHTHTHTHIYIYIYIYIIYVYIYIYIYIYT